MSLAEASPAGPTPSPSGSRAVSACELLLGAFVVVAHNVFGLLPNEVPILFVAGLLSIRLRDGGWSSMGLRRPPSWTSPNSPVSPSP